MRGGPPSAPARLVRDARARAQDQDVARRHEHRALHIPAVTEAPPSMRAVRTHSRFEDDREVVAAAADLLTRNRLTVAVLNVFAEVTNSTTHSGDSDAVPLLDVPHRPVERHEIGRRARGEADGNVHLE